MKEENMKNNYMLSTCINSAEEYFESHSGSFGTLGPWNVLIPRCHQQLDENMCILKYARPSQAKNKKSQRHYSKPFDCHKFNDFGRRQSLQQTSMSLYFGYNFKLKVLRP